MARKAPPFEAIHRHGFVRAGAASPTASSGDVAFNIAQAIALAREGDARGCDLVVYPELNLSSCGRHLHLQEAFLDAVEQASRAVQETRALLRSGVAPAAPNGRLTLRARPSPGRHAGRRAEKLPAPITEIYERGGCLGIGLNARLEWPAGRHPSGRPIFAAEDLADFIFHVEICEDYWAPQPPSTVGALAGALILCNLSASNITIGKADERKLLCASQSSRCTAAYVYAASGPGESTTDLAWDGQSAIYEIGELLCESNRFDMEPELCVADVDAQRLRLERMRMPTFNDNAVAAGHPEKSARRIHFEHRPGFGEIGFQRRLRRFPYVPNRPERLDLDCYEAFNIQVQGLARRFQATSGGHLVIGVSGGLDSTHALIVAAKMCDFLKLPRTTVLGFTMPGFATGDTTKSNAWKLMKALGIVGEEIDIRPAAMQMLKDMGHPYAEGEPVYDIAFENVQAGLRTDYLFRLANQRWLVSAPATCPRWPWAGHLRRRRPDEHYGVNAGGPRP